LSAGAHGAKKGAFGAAAGSLSTLYERRWLIWYFIVRQISKDYRNSILGFVWAFLSPLFLIALYTLVFSEIIGIRFREVPGDSSLNFGLYLYCGILPFLAFSDAMNQSTNAMRANSNLVNRVVFPTEIIPLSTAVTTVVDKLFGLGVLILVLAVLGYGVKWALVFLPLIVALQLLFTLGLSYLFSVLGTYLPDVRETLRAIVRASFFVTPIIWPVERVEGKPIEWVVDLNPLAFLVQSYRDLVINGDPPDVTATLYFALFAGALFIFGFTLFVRTKKRFADLL
jgi:ABC-type polysaccharide/polyol phosphate export permease